MSLHDSKLQLNALLLEDVFESSRSLGARVRWHYSMQLLQCAPPADHITADYDILYLTPYT